MSADRPLSARYGELVYPKASWSPTVAQALGLLEINMGKELPLDLIDSFVKSSAPNHKDVLVKLLASHNQTAPKMRKLIAPITMQSAALSVLHSPGEPFFQDEMEARNATLIAAVAFVGIQKLNEI